MSDVCSSDDEGRRYITRELHSENVDLWQQNGNTYVPIEPRVDTMHSCNMICLARSYAHLVSALYIVDEPRARNLAVQCSQERVANAEQDQRHVLWRRINKITEGGEWGWRPDPEEWRVVWSLSDAAKWKHCHHPDRQHVYCMCALHLFECVSRYVSISCILVYTKKLILGCP